MKSQHYSIVNGKILTPHRCIANGSVQVENGVITGVYERAFCAPGSAEIDAGGLYIAPGFIDIHVHGGGGADFMDATDEAFQTVAATHLRHGTTAMTPTTLTAGKEELAETLTVCQRVMAGKTGGVRFLGMHLEGPYFALNQRGAQDPRFIRDPAPEEYQSLIDRFPGVLSRWSAAPELPGALDFARHAVSKGILVSLAHTDAL
ncbi:amidohydrolase family protein [Larkinella terrae]|uniref:amidohydrolase family protein n=1 Tax=Larkinella terrae TaxID=2025311 RepID=UPI00286E6E5A|nr:amidohydrolase family protein [Larkinella terrae]